MIDITLLPTILDLAELTGPASGADDAALAYGNAGFDGSELGQLVWGMTGRTVEALQKQATPFPVDEALTVRGAMLITSGRLCCSVGGLVLEPAGRQWALVTPEPGRYSWAGLAPTVTYTMRRT